MDALTRLEQPLACTERERREFARLVRLGFAFARDVDGRILSAKWLALHYPAGEALGAIAALKAPPILHRQDIFAKAGAPVSAAEYDLELGWVYVLPDYRGKRVAESLCRRLLARAPTSRMFATTRTNNRAMMKILVALGFTPSGRPYARRDEELGLYLRD